MAGISLDQAYGKAPPSDAKPSGGISLSTAYAKPPADKPPEKPAEESELSRMAQIAGTRFAQGVEEIPGIPRDTLTLMAKYLPKGAMTSFGMEPLLEAERARLKKEGDAPALFSGENFRGLAQYAIPALKPPKPRGPGEQAVGNIAEFAGGMLAPGGGEAKIGTKALQALGGGTGLTLGQILAPDNPLVQILGGMAGAHTPGALVASGERVAPALASTRRATTETGREATVGETLNRQATNFEPSFDPKAMQEKPELKVEGTKIVRAPAGAAPRDAVPGVKPTLAQSRGDESLLALQEHAAGKDPKLDAALVRRGEENKTAARGALEQIRGQGVPADATTHAADTVRSAEQAVRDQRSTQRTGRTQEQISDSVRERLEGSRQAARTEENRLWGAFRGLGDRANVPVKPLQIALTKWLQSQDIKPEMPAEIKRALQQFGKTTNVTRVQALRPELRELRQTAEASGDMRSARVYSGLERVVGDYLDTVTLKDPELKQAYQAARDFSRQRAGIFNVPREMRTTLGSDRMGGERVASGATLERFLRAGPEGRDAVRSLFAADGSPEMRRMVADYLVGDMPEKASDALKWIKNHEPLLRELGPNGAATWLDHFHGIADRQAALEALRKSPLGMLTEGITPETAVMKIMNGSDPIGTAKVLREQMRTNPAAWAGMQRSFADAIIARITNINARDLQDRASIVPGELSRFTHEQGALARVFLGEQGVKTLENIDSALQMVGRRATVDVPNPKTAMPSLTGSRFIDRIVESFKNRGTEVGASIAGFGAGQALAGTVGGLAGLAAGPALHGAASSATESLQAVFRDALLNPEVGNALMHRASAQTLPRIPKPLRSYFSNLLGTAAGAEVTAKPREKPAASAPSRVVAPAPIDQSSEPSPTRLPAELREQPAAPAPITPVRAGEGGPLEHQRGVIGPVRARPASADVWDHPENTPEHPRHGVFPNRFGPGPDNAEQLMRGHDAPPAMFAPRSEGDKPTAVPSDNPADAAVDVARSAKGDYEQIQLAITQLKAAHKSLTDTMAQGPSFERERRSASATNERMNREEAAVERNRKYALENINRRIAELESWFKELTSNPDEIARQDSQPSNRRPVTPYGQARGM